MRSAPPCVKRGSWREIRYRGKTYTRRDIDEIREIIIVNPDKSRWFISREICRRWGWRQPNGVLKDMICRALFLQLEARGFIELPPRRPHPDNPLLRPARPEVVEVDQTPLGGKLSDLQPIQLLPVRRTPIKKLYQSLMAQFHYFDYRRPVGEHLEHLALSRERPDACLGCQDGERGNYEEGKYET